MPIQKRHRLVVEITDMTGKWTTKTIGQLLTSDLKDCGITAQQGFQQNGRFYRFANIQVKQFNLVSKGYLRHLNKEKK